MFFPKFFYMTKTTPFSPVLHVFAPLNDVRTYSARSWKTTLITWIFGWAWYPPWHSSAPPPPPGVISYYPPPIPSYINIFEALLQNREQLSDTLGKMSFWYHCKEHMFSFNLKSKPSSYSYFLRYDNFCMCKTINSFSGSVILRKGLLSFLFLFGFDRL